MQHHLLLLLIYINGGREATLKFVSRNTFMIYRKFTISDLYFDAGNYCSDKIKRSASDDCEAPTISCRKGANARLCPSVAGREQMQGTVRQLQKVSECFKTEYFKTAKIINILKSGDSNSTTNYIIISLLKMFKKIMFA